jgi:hypothetical protein
MDEKAAHRTRTSGCAPSNLNQTDSNLARGALTNNMSE